MSLLSIAAQSFRCLTGREILSILHNLWPSDVIILACGLLWGREDLGGGDCLVAVSFLRGLQQRVGRGHHSQQLVAWMRPSPKQRQRGGHPSGCPCSMTVGCHRWSVPSGVS